MLCLFCCSETMRCFISLKELISSPREAKHVLKFVEDKCSDDLKWREVGYVLKDFFKIIILLFILITLKEMQRQFGNIKKRMEWNVQETSVSVTF